MRSPGGASDWAVVSFPPESVTGDQASGNGAQPPPESVDSSRSSTRLASARPAPPSLPSSSVTGTDAVVT